MHLRVLWTFPFLVLMVFLHGCASAPSSKISRDFLQVPDGPAVENGKLEPGDSIELSVEVDGIMEVARQHAKINLQGIVTLPLVGDVEIGGLDLEKAREAILKRYGAYYVHPPVIMIVRQDQKEVGEWGQVTVLGQVRQPGAVPLASARGINLSAAIQAAGGFAASAKTGDIRVTRIGDDGKKMRVSVDFDEIGMEGNAEADLKLVAGDIVYVPERIF